MDLICESFTILRTQHYSQLSHDSAIITVNLYVTHFIEHLCSSRKSRKSRRGV